MRILAILISSWTSRVSTGANRQSMQQGFFYIGVLVLALMLFFPVSKIVWVLSVRRAQRKQGKTLSSEESNGQLARARFIAVLLVSVFSWLFNLQLYSRLYG